MIDEMSTKQKGISMAMALSTPSSGASAAKTALPRARRLIAASLTAAAVAALLVMSGCESSPCLLEEGCSHLCESDDDCDDDRFGEEPLLCRDVYDGVETERRCTRACSDSSDCDCACGSSPDQGFCVGSPPEDPATCRADAPSLKVMCEDVYWGRFSACCTVTGVDIDACAGYPAQFPACEAELTDFFLCAYRSRKVCEGEGVYAQGECAAQVAALEACAGGTWNVFRPDGC